MLKSRALLISAFTLLSTAAFAQDANATAAAEGWIMNQADSAWVLVSAALVLLMTPGLALFYGGMVRRKNVLSTYLHSFIMLGFISILWLVVGYSIAFGKGSAFFGSMEFFLGKNVSMTDPYPHFDPKATTIPNGLFMLFQMMFAIITPALISGAIAERMKFSGYVIFSILWSLLIYAPVACWVWNPMGWLCVKGALDFAGGTVVHLASGASALAACIVLGRRRALDHKEPILPNNLTTTLLGAGLLWFGWIGFNAGSALSVGDIAINAFLTTHIAAAAGMLGWLLVEKLHVGKPTALGAASGLVAGLVAITPGAGFVSPLSAIIIGFVVAALCCLAVGLKSKLKYDDSLDVVGVHGVGGFLGAIATGIFADGTVNAVAETALANGRGALILTQFIGVAAVGAFAFVGTVILLKIIQALGMLRVSPEDEDAGLDLTLHGEAGYNL
jgi:Amt family ammonium transporter